MSKIDIVHILLLSGRKLFGPGYSGLEYDYRGLLRLYNNKGENQKVKEGKKKQFLCRNAICNSVIGFDCSPNRYY